MLRTFNSNGLKVYSMSSGKSIPQFALENIKNKSKLKHDAEYQHRIELIHDLEFPQCCNALAISPDLRYIIASGVYPPQIGIYDTLELSLKHRRGIDNEVLKISFLEQDYTKIACLCTQRFIEFHNRGGRHHKIRVPKEGRDMKYVSDHASLFVATSCNELFRVNLEKGVFDEPYKSICGELNCISENPILPLISSGGDGSILESWDLRNGESVSKLKCSDEFVDITSCSYSSNGLKIAVGSSDGLLRIYDIRNNKPLWVKDSMNDSSINCIEWINSLNYYTTDVGNNSLIAWSDYKTMRVNNIEDGEFIVSIEGLKSNDKNSFNKINSFKFYPDTGICFIVGDQTRIGTYFIPSIGPAPSWSSFLENITEEMEYEYATNTGIDKKTQPYDEYTFVTREQLDELSATNLIGTKMVKDYMHGYFINKNLYKKLKILSSDFDYESYKKQKMMEKIEEKRQMRVPIRTKKIKVNVELAEKLEATASITDLKGLDKKQKESIARAKQVLSDERFAKIFTDENFAIEHVDASTTGNLSKKKNKR